jgi:carboxylesterase
MGAALALDVAARAPDRVRGLVLVNPYVRDPRLVLAGGMRVFMRSVKGVGNDIKKPGQDECAASASPCGRSRRSIGCTDGRPPRCRRWRNHCS